MYQLNARIREKLRVDGYPPDFVNAPPKLKMVF